jgi:pentatricopeptide repeat protein
MDYLYALADYYVKREQWEKAKSMANQMVAKHPDHPVGRQLLGLVNKRLQDKTE